MAAKIGFLKHAIGRVRREGLGLLPYALGRFHTVRTLYSAQASVTQGKKKQAQQATVFPGTDVAKAVASICAEAVYWPVTLADDAMKELREIAQTAELSG